MPDNKRIQVPGESYCPLLFLPDDGKPSAKPLVSLLAFNQLVLETIACSIFNVKFKLQENGTRLDGRKHSEIRPLCKSVYSVCYCSAQC